ncbi:hypothetical protein C6Y40_12230 [Alteromonas alba]|uniref:Uncharacterized protein n=1 Tax=Alteromonas alba TaxID=2079529 RepID=A0A2S9VA33_9ALTE|nr:hypothetical protein [Alteromonas alba]PRO73293.1 hypothetical protein C6Y40_12230 [Alteromonas alba]|tara:strand:+ start:659 stop:1120 length:462 start_codon:yes stop_codon:yes gene_type:complete
MKKIITKWLLISLGVGMIPVVILGASQGGIALSPLILLFFLMVGLAGSAVHANIYAYRKGTKKQKIQGSVFAGISALVIGFLVYSESRCELRQEYATERASGYVRSKPDLDIKNLSEPVFDLEKCVCTFEYSSPTTKFEIFVSEYGELHFSPH